MAPSGRFSPPRRRGSRCSRLHDSLRHGPLPHVSVPSSSGLSLLAGGIPPGHREESAFQSPRRRGSRCSPAGIHRRAVRAFVSVPSSSGLSFAREEYGGNVKVGKQRKFSVPSSSGLSLLAAESDLRAGIGRMPGFQSPSSSGLTSLLARDLRQEDPAILRVSSPLVVGALRCSVPVTHPRATPKVQFQSPRRRGSRCSRTTRMQAAQRHHRVSVPSSSGLSLLERDRPDAAKQLPTFQSPRRRGSRCSVPQDVRVGRHMNRFQSPRRRGSRCS